MNENQKIFVIRKEEIKLEKMFEMTEYQIQLPEELKLDEFELKMLIAGRLYEQGRLSSGQASQVVGISKRTFLELLGKYDISIFGYDFNELEKDLASD